MTGIDRRALLGIVPAALLGRVAYGQDFRPQPLPQGQRRAVKLAVGGVADVTHLAVWYAKFGGFFGALQAQGIDVEVVPFGGGSEWLLALTSGQVDMAHGYYENAVRARSQGRDVILIDDILPTPVFKVIVRADLADKVKSVKDARGLTWGFTSFGSATHVVSLRVAKAFGLDQKDVKWVGVGGTTGYLPSMREKRVDILTASLFAGIQLLEEGSAKLLQDMTDAGSVAKIYGHPYLGPGMLASRAYCDKEPFATFSVVSAVRKAIAAAKAEPAEQVAKTLPAEFQTDTIVASVKATVDAFAADGEIQLAAVTAMIGDMSDLRLGKGGIEPADTFDNRFIRAVKAGA